MDDKQIQTYVHEIAELEQANLSLQGDYLSLQAELKELKARALLSESQNYCKICGNILDGYKNTNYVPSDAIQHPEH